MQVLIFDGQGFAGLDPKTGKQFWREPWSTNQGINVAQPTLVGDDRVFVSSGYSVGGGLFHVAKVKDEWAVERLWRDRRSMQCKFTSPVLHEGRLYGISDIDLVCIDVKTGKRLWTGPDVGYGQVVLRGDVLLVLTEKGAVVMAAANPARYEELGRFELFGEKTWNTPTLAGDKLYLRNHQRMFCYQLPTAAPALASSR
jgi:outer membrane protein assembly factor BamB